MDKNIIYICIIIFFFFLKHVFMIWIDWSNNSNMKYKIGFTIFIKKKKSKYMNVQLFMMFFLFFVFYFLQKDLIKN